MLGSLTTWNTHLCHCDDKITTIASDWGGIFHGINEFNSFNNAGDRNPVYSHCDSCNACSHGQEATLHSRIKCNRHECKKCPSRRKILSSRLSNNVWILRKWHQIRYDQNNLRERYSTKRAYHFYQVQPQRAAAITYSRHWQWGSWNCGSYISMRRTSCGYCQFLCNA